MRALRLLAVAGGLLALAGVAGSSRAARESASAVAVAAGPADTCALTSAGGVECWGYIGHDEFGDGQIADSEHLRDHPRRRRQMLGRDLLRRTGDGTTGRHRTPVVVAGLSADVQAISAGQDDACAVTGSRGAKCWGYNLFGQLGDGTATDRATPVDVSGLTSGVTAIASGLNLRTCVIAGVGRVIC